MGQRLLTAHASHSVDCDGTGNCFINSRLQVVQPMSWRFSLMKSTIQRVVLAVAVATLGAGALVTASAQTTSSAPVAASPNGHHHGQFRRFGRGRFVGSLLRATQQLNLTADQ